MLELGAGAALPSIVSALSGAERVVVTDFPTLEGERNMSYNMDINMEGISREKTTVMVSSGAPGGASQADE